jgi:hypothetical protein
MVPKGSFITARETCAWLGLGRKKYEFGSKSWQPSRCRPATCCPFDCLRTSSERGMHDPGIFRVRCGSSSVRRSFGSVVAHVSQPHPELKVSRSWPYPSSAGGRQVVSVVRPARDCSAQYGYAITVRKVTKLTAP